MTVRPVTLLLATILTVAPIFAPPLTAKAQQNTKAPIAQADAAIIERDRAALADLRAEDTRFHTLAWRLVTGNAQFCADTVPAIGMVLQDVAVFGYPDRARAAAGIDGDFFIQLVVPGSPAESSGLRAGDELLAIGAGRAPDSIPLDRKKPWQRQMDLQDEMDAELVATGAIILRWQTGGEEFEELGVPGVPTCASRFELRTNGDDALAEGQRIVFGREFPGFAYADDELAAAIAHELAHNVLRHRAWLATQGRKRRAIRETEREADRMMPWLLANAGFEPEAASRFMKHWGRKHGGGLFRKRTHDGWDERLEAIEEEILLVRKELARGGKADWRSRFQPRVD